MQCSRRPSAALAAALCYLLACQTLALPLKRRESFAPSSTPARAASRQPAARQAARREGELIVRFREEASDERKAELLGARGARLRRKLRGESRAERVTLRPGLDAAAAAGLLSLSPEVELAEPNYLIARAQFAPDDARFPEQWALHNTGQTGGTGGSDVAALRAWQATTGAASTVVAVVDGGIDFTHPDLAGQRWMNAREGAGGGDEDGNGYADDLGGWDWVTDSGQVVDPGGHGTAVAGLIAARGNDGAGVSGVMWAAGVLSLRVLDAGGAGDVADAVEAIDYASAAGAQVINCSWGTEGESRALREAVERAGRRGAVVVASAGNGSRDLDAGPYYPAGFDLPNLVAVAATDQFDNLAPFSNWGAARVGVAAPGTDLLTTARGGGGHLHVSGTSFAAALASGVAGLVLTARPWLRAADVRQALVEGARPVAALGGQVSAGGVLDAAGALEASAFPGDNDGRGRERQTPRPPAGGGNRGDGAGKADPPAPAPVEDGALPNLSAHHSQPSHVPEPPPAGISSNAPPICNDCFEAGGTDPEFSNARSLLKNETGQPNVDVGSMNFNFAVPLVSLPGRAGLDLDLTLHYNSLVWARQASTVQYNPDTGYPSPGFRLGFPAIQKQFADSEAGTAALMLVTPAGARVKLRQKSTGVFESVDGSYMRLTTHTGGALLRTSDGTQYAFDNTSNGEKRCREIKDRNGNYITVAYDASGRVQSVTDTLGRVVNFVYNGNGTLYQLTQARGAGLGSVLAQFSYRDVTISGPYFVDEAGNLITMRYPTAPFSALATVWTPDGVTHVFDYTGLGQVYKITRQAPDQTPLSETWYNLPASPETPNIALHDCPRFTQRRDTVRFGVMQQTQSSSTYFLPAADDSSTQVTLPDGTILKEFFATSGWQKGLTTSTEVWSGGARKKWTTTAWTQDNPAATYAQNPRPAEANVYDSDNHRRQTLYTYTTASGVSLPSEVKEYGGTHASVSLLRRSVTAYRWDAAYLDRRIIGLPDSVLAYDAAGALLSKTTYGYDWDFYGDMFQDVPGGVQVTQHDRGAYGPSFVTGRGNLSEVARWDVTAADDINKITETKWRVNVTGSVLMVRDQDWHEVSLGYADSFSDGQARTTYAYPTRATDAAGYAATTEYHFATGQPTRTTRPSSGTAAANNVTYETQTFTYDTNARPLKVLNENSGFYTRWEYAADLLSTRSYSNVKTGTGVAESYAAEFYDGAGRVRLTSRHLPESTTRFGGQKFFYDAMGRLARHSKPTAMLDTWAPADAADDDWAYTDQAYDWQGRPTLTTLPDLHTVEATYGGCGCAGGAVTTVKDEAGRRRRLYSDPLGRLSKVEELNWNQTLYSTTTYAYNGRDQLTRISQQGQVRTFEYDGHGRLWKRTTPEQGAVEFAYNRDDTPAWAKDARGVKTLFEHDTRHLTTSVSYDLTGAAAGQGVAATAGADYEYDAAGNRTKMTDGLGTATYAYDSLSRLTRETRAFAGVGTYNLTYAYSNAGLASVTNHWGSRVSYQTDHTGAVTSVTGSDTPTYAQSIQYRAFGGLKALTYGNGRRLAVEYDSRLRATSWDVAGLMGSEYQYDDFYEHTGRVTYARNLYDPTLDRSYEYDHVGRLVRAYTDREAEAHATAGVWPETPAGPYAHAYTYDVWGNTTARAGWGGPNAPSTSTYANNRKAGWVYDLAGNLKDAGGHLFSYDATGRQVSASASGSYSIQSGYDGDRLRAKKTEGGVTTYYLRSSVLGGAVVAEIRQSAGAWVWARGFVYLGGQLLAIRANGTASYSHEDPVTKARKLTSTTGVVTSSAVTDPFGGEIASGPWVLNSAQQPRKFTTYARDADGADEAGHRRYRPSQGRFDQPDPADFSYDLSDPQSLNRYAYTQNDPVNFTDPSGLLARPGGSCIAGDGGAGIVGADGQCYAGPREGVTVRGGGAINEGLLSLIFGRMALDLYLFPQNPAGRRLGDAELAAIRGELESMLASDNCRSFIDKLVSFNTGQTFDSLSLLGYFDSVAKSAEGGIFFAPGDGGLSRQRREDYPKVFIGDAPRAGTLPSALAAGYRASAQTALHELIHAVTYGSDDRLSQDIQKLGIVPVYNGKTLPPPTGERGGKPYNDYSGYWGSALGNACHPQGEFKP